MFSNFYSNMFPPSYNKSQPDALFLKFILIKYSTCFRQVHCHHHENLNTVYTAIGICHTGYVDRLLADVNVTSKTNTYCVYTVLRLLVMDSTYLLTPWSRVLLEKLTGSADSQEIPHILGTQRFITVLTSAHHLSLS